MKPELPAPQRSFENQSPAPDYGELLPTPEIADDGMHEKEQAMRQVDRQTAPPPQIPLPAQPQVVALPTIPQPSADDAAGPTIANDDDLIEKEWVDKAKKIIADTQNDPYRREQEVNKLQVDYLRKRYGKELGTSN